LVVEFYERVGYLPEAVVNYLLLLGWALDDRTEWFTREQMIEAFSLERVNKAPASFDPQKLMAFQEHYMRSLPVQRRAGLALPYLVRAGLAPSPPSEELTQRLLRVVRAAGDRIKVAGDILNYDDFFTPGDRLAYDEKAFGKRVRSAAGAVERLGRFAERLQGVEPFEAAALERLMHEFVESEEIKMGQIIHAVRVAVTGKAVGFGLFEALEILGRETCLDRIRRALERV
jgi:glutamyl-tRNA synthetase